MQLKAIIIDDDINYALETEMILDDIGVEIVGKFKTWKDVLSKVKKLKPDFIVLDIFLAQKENGLDFAEKLNQLYIPYIICTGYPYDEYADKAFEFGAYGFFSKPLDKAAFSYKVRQLIAERTNASNENYISIKHKSIHIKIPYKEIQWLEIDGNYTSLVLVSGKKYIQKQSLKKFLPQLDDTFKQIHRSYVVNTYHAKSIDINANTLEFRNGTSLPIGSKYKTSIVQLFQ